MKSPRDSETAQHCFFYQSCGDIQMQTKPQPRFLRLPEVIEVTGFKRASIYRKMAAGEFPAAYALGPHAIGWLSADVDQWVNSRAHRAPGEKIGRVKSKATAPATAATTKGRKAATTTAG
jgi:prophage regulatory protein